MCLRKKFNVNQYIKLHHQLIWFGRTVCKAKNPDCDVCKIKKQIIVCESGKFKSVNRSEFDVELDAHTVKPGSFYLEKLCSGAYMGSVAQYALIAAAKENVFSKTLCQNLANLTDFTTIEMSSFLQYPYSSSNMIGNLLIESKATDEDYDKMFQLLDAIAERSARYAAAILVACVLQTGEGKNAAKPVCILCNGSTFYKTHMINNRVHAYLDAILTEQKGLYWEIVSVDDDIIAPEYKVGLDGGVTIGFENNGKFDNIKSKNGNIPAGIIPAKIVETAKAQYPDAIIIEYDADKRSYEIKLSNRMELTFDSNFNLVEIDD